MINDYWVYVVLAFTITAIPGPAVVLTIKNSLKYGYKMAIINIFGNFVAMVILAAISAAGIGALVLASSALFSAMKTAGCVYLLYLGVKAWMAPGFNDNLHFQNKRKLHKEISSVFREGFGVGISNPKAIVFFTALFPQFIDPSRSFTPQFFTLILTIEGISFLVLSTYALISTKTAPYLSYKNSGLLFNKLAGIAFVGFGLALLCED